MTTLSASMPRSTDPRPQKKQGLVHEVVDATTDLDFLIHSDDVHELSLEAQRPLRERFIKEALEHHLNACSSYARYYSRCVGDRAPQALALEQIPLIPTSVFKRQQVLSVPDDAVQKWCLSSGTQGERTRLGRDHVTLERLLGSIRSGLQLVTPWEEHEVDMVHLGPDRDEAGDVWFMYVMSLTELIYPTQHFVQKGDFDAQGAAERIRSLVERDEGDVAIVTTPFQLLNLVEYLEDRQLKIRGGSTLSVFTAGGWKRHTGRMIPRDVFDARVVDGLGLNDQRSIRDVFNQVELNTVLFECSAHRKHLPPWVWAVARDPATLEPVENGQPGILSYLDASATSYPCFLITDDVGVVEEGLCGCGREGLTVQIHRRVTRTSARGCALTLDKKNMEKR